MPLNNPPTPQSQAAITPQAPIADVNSSAIDTSYNQSEVDVLNSLRIAVNAILEVMRAQKLIRGTIPYTASQSSVYGNLAASFANLSDGIDSSGAGTNNDTNAWIQADCGLILTISSVGVAGGSISGWGGVALYLNSSAIEVSQDSSAWVRVAAISGMSDSGSDRVRTFTFSPIAARYVRIVRSGWLATTELVIS